MYTIRYVHRNNTYYIASNNEGNFIILESLDSEFRMGHQISYDGEKVFNLTQRWSHLFEQLKAYL